jgi:hypothetical protein
MRTMAIKKLAVKIYSLFEDMGRAKAAGIMARAGDYKGAVALMNQRSA